MSPKNLMVIGLLLVSGGALAGHFKFTQNDFISGFAEGIGLGIMIAALYRMKRNPTHGIK